MIRTSSRDSAPSSPRRGNKYRLLAVMVACSWAFLAAASCDKGAKAKPVDQPSLPDDEPGKAMEHKGDESEKTPVPGIDISKLSAKDSKLYNKMLNTQASPCGDAKSLRKSALEGSTCKRGIFGVRFVLQLVKDGVPEDDIRELYGLAYKDIDKQHEFGLSESVPHKGPVDARVKIVEFFDYGCPACKMFKADIEQAQAAYPQDTVVYYKMFPLAAHKDSGGAAQAALAAHAQGKFKEMHDALFADQYKHKIPDLKKHAEKIGLDMKKYEADFTAVASKVEADKKEGGDLVQGTPTVFVNGRKFPNLPQAYLKLRIEEELAVNR